MATAAIVILRAAFISEISYEVRMIWHKVCVFAFCILPLACAGGKIKREREPQTVRIKATDNVLLIQRWAEEFMKSHPGKSVYTEDGSCRSGVRALLNGTVDILFSCEPMPSMDEYVAIQDEITEISSLVVGRDALTVYIHPDNPVKSITLEQIKNIFDRKTTNWHELGGRDEPIWVLCRPPNSNTGSFFEQMIGGISDMKSVKIVPTTAATIDSVSTAPGAIGYGRITRSKQVFQCWVNGVAPITEYIKSGAYPLSGTCHIYIIGQPDNQLKDFIDWIFGDKGQTIATELGMVVL